MPVLVAQRGMVREISLHNYRDGIRIFAVAGIYEIWTDKKTGIEKYSYSLITTEPTDVVGKVHPRMPAIVRNKEDEEAWLNPDTTEPEHLLPLLQPYAAADEMEGWRVPDTARNPRNDSPEILDQVAPLPA